MAINGWSRHSPGKVCLFSLSSLPYSPRSVGRARSQPPQQGSRQRTAGLSQMASRLPRKPCPILSPSSQEAFGVGPNFRPFGNRAYSNFLRNNRSHSGMNVRHRSSFQRQNSVRSLIG